MKVPNIQLSQSSKNAIKELKKASKKERLSIGEQMKMANYYAYLKSEKNAKDDIKNFARTLIGG